MRTYYMVQNLSNGYRAWPNSEENTFEAETNEEAVFIFKEKTKDLSSFRKTKVVLYYYTDEQIEEDKSVREEMKELIRLRDEEEERNYDEMRAYNSLTYPERKHKRPPKYPMFDKWSKYFDLHKIYPCSPKDKRTVFLSKASDFDTGGQKWKEELKKQQGKT